MVGVLGAKVRRYSLKLESEVEVRLYVVMVRYLGFVFEVVE